MVEQLDSQKGKIWYLDSMRETINLQFVNLENYAKLLITIAATILSLSIIAVKILLPSDKTLIVSYINLLNISYSSFVLSILLAILSFLILSTAINKHLKNFHTYYTSEGEKKFACLIGLTKFIKWLNVIAGLTFVIAIAYLVMFVIKSIG